MPGPYQSARPHPWHGLEPGDGAPAVVDAYIEITPFDLVKYEIDKKTGYLRVDRAQRTSSLPPTLYGFIPRTYAGDRVGALMVGSRGGDLDPLDICVLTERPIARAEVLIRTRVVGGIPMLDGGAADDKIIGILDDDPVFGHIRNVDEVPAVLVGRLRHYFATYKLRPETPGRVEVGEAYGTDRARSVIEAALADYRDAFGAHP